MQAIMSRQRAHTPHGVRLAGRDAAKVGHPFTRSVAGTSLVSDLQTSHTAPSPQVGVTLLSVTAKVRDNARRPADLRDRPAFDAIATTDAESSLWTR
jgi:hypothetical protein